MLGPLRQMDGAKGFLIPILMCFADQIPGTRGWSCRGWKQCGGPGAQPQTRGFVHSYEENTKCINLSIYLHVFLKGSLPEIYPLGKMLLVAGRHRLLYIKNKEKRKKKKENVFKKVIYFLLLLLFYFFKLCSKPIFSLGPSIKIAAASFLYGLCDAHGRGSWPQRSKRALELSVQSAYYLWSPPAPHLMSHS